MRTRLAIALGLAICLLGSPGFAAVKFIPTGAIDMIPTGISDDGSIIVGASLFGAPNLYYTQAGGVVVIGNGGYAGHPVVSGDGSTILASELDANGVNNAARWLGDTNWEILGPAPGGVACGFDLSSPWGINQDGTVGVGLVWLAQICQAEAGVWDLVQGGDAGLLENLVPGRATRANDVDDDGGVIVGWQDSEVGQRQAAKWIDGREELILNDMGRPNGEALAISGDGKAIVGVGYDFLGAQGWLWREGLGMTPIGNVHGTYLPDDVSDDGTVVVGVKTRNFFLRQAFIWTQQSGVMTLDKYLAKKGASPPAGWDLSVASLITPDKRFIVGWGINPQSLIEMYIVDTQAP